MRSSVFAAALAMAAPAFAADDDCKDVTIKSNSATTSCKDGAISGDLTIDGSAVSDTLTLNGFRKIGGDFKVINAGKLLSIQSGDLSEVDGVLNITSCNLLGEINLSGVKNLNQVHLQSLPQLQKINFGSTGKTKAKSVDVVDTGLSDLSGLNLASVDDFTIITNKQLQMFNSDLTKVGKTLTISKNGKNMDVNMTVLESAEEILVDGGVRSFDAPALQKISALRFNDNPNFESFTAKNLTQIGPNVKNPGSVSFIGNDKLTNISFPSVTKIFGDLTVKKNHDLTELTGFPKLQRISGALLLAGEFKTIDLPKLTRVDGAATVTSTKDISKFCDGDDGFKKYDAQSAKNQCKGQNKDANKAKNGDKLDGSDSSSDEKDAANAAVVSLTTLGAALCVGLYQLL